MELANTLVYYNAATITAVKSFIEQDLGGEVFISSQLMHFVFAKLDGRASKAISRYTYLEHSHWSLSNGEQTGG
jgi:hypothetical protein